MKVLMVLSLLIPSLARAEPRTDDVTYYELEDDLVTGDRVVPEGTEVFVVRALRKPSLISLRASFIAELVKSVEDL